MLQTKMTNYNLLKNNLLISSYRSYWLQRCDCLTDNQFSQSRFIDPKISTANFTEMSLIVLIIIIKKNSNNVRINSLKPKLRNTTNEY